MWRWQSGGGAGRVVGMRHNIRLKNGICFSEV
jgi:hypothetical protein